MQAQETSAKSIENARKEAELIIQEAELKASQIIDHARLEIMDARDEVANLKSKKETLTGRLRVLLNSEMELIKALEAEEEINRRAPGQGTGNENFQIDDVIKKL